MTLERDLILRRAQTLEITRREASVHALEDAQRRGFGVRTRTRGRVFSLAADAVASLEHNVTTGLLLDPRDADASLAEAIAFHREGPQAFRLPIAESLTGPAHEAALRAAGLTWWRRRVFFARDLGAATPPVATPFTVRRARADEQGALAALSAEVFGMDAAFAAWGAAAAADPRWTRFGAFDGATPIATARLFVDGEGAWLSGMATRPEHQRRGAQQALLAARLDAARDAGARWIVLETLADDAGEPDGSGRNALRMGFRVVDLLRSWVPVSA